MQHHVQSAHCRGRESAFQFRRIKIV
jgi:hypothetical protein